MTNDKPNKTFKVLAIDGGGIKGLYSAAILKVFEEKYGTITDYFDLLCGTSTGGLIALALAADQSAAEIVEFYKNSGPKIFEVENCNYKYLCKNIIPKIPKINKFFAGKCLLQICSRSKYYNNNLKTELNKVFGDALLSNSNSHLCIPTLDISSGKPWVFKTGHSADYFRDPDTLMRDVALCTSSAPTYFPIARIAKHPSRAFVDGGIWSNNPSLVGLIEALTHFVSLNSSNKPYSHLKILSISSGSCKTNKLLDDKLEKSYFDWGIGSDFISLLLDSQGYATEFQTELLCRALNCDYVRIDRPDFSTREASEIDLDKTDFTALELLENNGETQGYKIVNNCDIQAFFNEKKEEK